MFPEYFDITLHTWVIFNVQRSSYMICMSSVYSSVGYMIINPSIRNW